MVELKAFEISSLLEFLVPTIPTQSHFQTYVPADVPHTSTYSQLHDAGLDTMLRPMTLATIEIESTETEIYISYLFTALSQSKDC